MSQYFSKPYEPFGGDINVEVDLSNYATKTDFKNAIVTDTSRLAAKSDLAGLKAKIDKLDIDKLVHVPVDLNKLNGVVKDDVVKKTVCHKLVAEANKIDNGGFVLKTKYDTDNSYLEKEILGNSGIVQRIDYNAKITKIENKIPSMSGLATDVALTAVENKIPNNSSLVKKQIRTQKLLKLKINLLIIIMINIFLLQN